MDNKSIESKAFTDPMASLPEGFVEVVAVPANPDFRVRVLNKGGQKYHATTDSDECEHFKIPAAYACGLVGSTSGLKFVLVGGQDKLTFTVRKGLYGEETTVLRHVKRKSSKGVVSWIPVVVEDPQAKPDTEE